MGVLSYFRKFFSYDPKFGLTLGNLGKLRFVRFLRRLNFKRPGINRFRGGVNGERFEGGKRWQQRRNLKRKGIQGEKQDGTGGRD